MGNAFPCGGRSSSSAASSCRESPAGTTQRSGLLAPGLGEASHKMDSKAVVASATASTSVAGNPNTAADALSHPNNTHVSSSSVMVSGTSGNGSPSIGTAATVGLLRRSEYVALRHLRLRRPRLRAVIGLPKHTHLYDAAKWALDRLGVDCVHAASTEDAVKACRDPNSAPNLLLVDARSNRDLNAENVATSIRNFPRGDFIVIVGIVKKSLFEREELTVAGYLAAGFNRLLVDSSSRGFWLNELAQLLHSDVDNCLRLACADTLLAALDAVSDIVQIADGEERLVFTNTASEKVLGFAKEDADFKERTVWDFQTPIGLAEIVLAEKEVQQQQQAIHAKGSEMVRQKLLSGATWEGSLNCRRKTGDFVPLESKAIPVQVIAKRHAEHVIYIKQPPPLLRDKAVTSASCLPPVSSASSALMVKKGGLKTFRNASCDVASIVAEAGGHLTANRRSSGSAKLHSLSVEAPITKVINLIVAAQANSPPYIAQALDKVLEILQATDSSKLFSPEVERERRKKTDAVTTDLLGALLAQGQKPFDPLSRSNSVMSRNSSTLSSSSMQQSQPQQRRRNSSRDVLYLRRGSTDALGKIPHVFPSHRPSIPTLDHSPAQARQLLEKSNTWAEFDIIELEKLTEEECLVWLGMATLLRFDVHKTLGCSEATLQNWLTLIEANYNANAYHNSTHAADVLHATSCFLESDHVKDYCDTLDEAVSLIAAVIHDLNHPGKNSAFLCNSNHELAILYNDVTVLENHHASLAFKLTMSDDRVNIFKKLDRETYKVVRQSIIDLVLATDMSKHFVHVNKFSSVFGRAAASANESGSSGNLASASGASLEAGGGGGQSGSGGGGSNPDLLMLNDQLPPSTPENVAIIKRMMIKCADVSNPARPLHLCKEWAFRIAEEYFSQTDDEKRLGLPVVMPQFDRTTCSIPKSQIGFYDFFIIDMFDMWNGFADLPELSDIIRTNYLYWKGEGEKEEQEKARLEQEKRLDEVDHEDDDDEDEDNDDKEEDGTIQMEARTAQSGDSGAKS